MVDNVLVGSSSNMCYNMRWCLAEKKSFWSEIAATKWIIIKLHRYCIWWTCRIRLMTCSGYLQTPNKWWCLVCIINAICCYCICTHWFTYLVETIEFIVVKTPVKLQGSRYGVWTHWYGVSRLSCNFRTLFYTTQTSAMVIGQWLWGTIW